jgi:hypothetical protein
VAVELDGRPWRVLPADAVVRAGLAVGRRLDRLESELHRARRALAREGVTPKSLRRLATRGFSRDTLDEVATTFALEA